MCYNELMIRKGDTLIEVTLAVGIFSMVAVAVVSVMSSSTSGAQTALESTLTREEIDAQAEALRFIQSAYIVNKEDNSGNKVEDDPFVGLWKAITDKAINIEGWSEESVTNLVQYAPSSCSDLYDNEGVKGLPNAFVIDYRNLGDFKNPENVLLSSSNAFTPATTYPRLVYTSRSGTSEDQTSLTDSLSGHRLSKAEGIYVIAIKDAGTTIIDGDNKSAFYDFYIRTCWYGTTAEEPSTISTVIRLYDPDIAERSKGN